jgi:hypothetical protein
MEPAMKACFFGGLFVVIPLLMSPWLRSPFLFVSCSSMMASIVIVSTLFALALNGPVEDMDIIFEMGVILWCLFWMLFCLVYYWILSRCIRAFSAAAPSRPHRR